MPESKTQPQGDLPELPDAVIEPLPTQMEPMDHLHLQIAVAKEISAQRAVELAEAQLAAAKSERAAATSHRQGLVLQLQATYHCGEQDRIEEDGRITRVVPTADAKK